MSGLDDDESGCEGIPEHWDGLRLTDIGYTVGVLNQKTVIQFVDYVLEKLPFEVDSIQTDNGSAFQSSFHWHVLDGGIRHVYIKPMTPRLNGEVERR